MPARRLFTTLLMSMFVLALSSAVVACNSLPSGETSRPIGPDGRDGPGVEEVQGIHPDAAADRLPYKEVSQALVMGDEVYLVVGDELDPASMIVRSDAEGSFYEEFYTSPAEFPTMVIHRIDDDLILIDDQWPGEGGSDLRIIDTATGSVLALVEGDAGGETIPTGSFTAAGKVFYQEFIYQGFQEPLEGEDPLTIPPMPMQVKMFDPQTGELTVVAEYDSAQTIGVGTREAAYWIVMEPTAGASWNYSVNRYDPEARQLENIRELESGFPLLVAHDTLDEIAVLEFNGETNALVGIDRYDGPAGMWSELEPPHGNWMPEARFRGLRLAGTRAVTDLPGQYVHRLITFDFTLVDATEHPIEVEGVEHHVSAYDFLDDDTIVVFARSPYVMDDPDPRVYRTLIHLGEIGSAG